jgi:hypothetical protein
MEERLKMIFRARLINIGIPLLGLAMAAHAGTFTFETAAGATESGGNAVDAKAIVTTGAGTVTVQLFNLLVNPTTVAQNISDFDFALSGTTSLGSLASSSGQDITVASNGTFTLGSTVATGWAFTSPTAGSYLLNVLGAAGPTHTILGAPGAGGTYSNANGSIAGNDPHNPFLNQSATFTLNITGVTTDTTVSSAIFSFGTAAGDNVPGGSGPNSTVPEPVSLSLVGSGLLALGLLRKRLPRK